jgi:hypothetical protein
VTGKPCGSKPEGSWGESEEINKTKKKDAVGRGDLLEAETGAFVENQLVKDSKHFAAVMVDALNRLSKGIFGSLAFRQTVHHFSRQLDIPAKRFGGMAAEKQAVEHRRFPLRRKRITLIRRTVLARDVFDHDLATSETAIVNSSHRDGKNFP